MPITGPSTASATALTASTPIFYLNLPKGTLRQIRVGSTGGGLMIDYVVLQANDVDYGNSVVISYEATGRANELVGWDGELPLHNHRWRLKVAFSGATAGWVVGVTALVDVKK